MVLLVFVTWGGKVRGHIWHPLPSSVEQSHFLLALTGGVISPGQRRRRRKISVFAACFNRMFFLGVCVCAGGSGGWCPELDWS